MIRQAIVTKYLGPTNHRGSRIKVKAYAGSKTYAWDHALDTNENHTKAAYAYATELGWLDRGETLTGGSMPDNSGNCYVITEKKEN